MIELMLELLDLINGLSIDQFIFLFVLFGFCLIIILDKQKLILKSILHPYLLYEILIIVGYTGIILFIFNYFSLFNFLQLSDIFFIIFPVIYTSLISPKLKSVRLILKDFIKNIFLFSNIFIILMSIYPFDFIFKVIIAIVIIILFFIKFIFDAYNSRRGFIINYILSILVLIILFLGIIYILFNSINYFYLIITNFVLPLVFIVLYLPVICLFILVNEYLIIYNIIKIRFDKPLAHEIIKQIFRNNSIRINKIVKYESYAHLLSNDISKSEIYKFFSNTPLFILTGGNIFLHDSIIGKYEKINEIPQKDKLSISKTINKKINYYVDYSHPLNEDELAVSYFKCKNGHVIKAIILEGNIPLYIWSPLFEDIYDFY